MHELLTPELVAQVSTQGGMAALLICFLMFVVKKFLTLTRDRDQQFLHYFNESRSDIILSIQNNTTAMNSLNKTIREIEDKNMVRHSQVKDKFSDILIRMERNRPN